MARLNYRLNFEQRGNGVGERLDLFINSNYVGTPYYRMYIEGSAPPAWSAVDLANGNGVGQFGGLGLWRIEYKDDNGERLIGQIYLHAQPDYCFNRTNGQYIEFGLNGWMIVSDSGISITTTIRRFPSINPAENLSVARNISIDGGVSFKNAADTSSSTLTWSNAEMNVLGIANSIPQIVIRRQNNGCTFSLSEEVVLDYEPFAPLVATYAKTNTTAAGTNDGTITLQVSGGSGNYTFLWLDGIEIQDRIGLAPGVYSVNVLDNTAQDLVVLDGIIISEPEPPQLPDEGSLLEFPILNDLQWVVDPIDPDVVPDNVSLDNVLFADQEYPGFMKTCYFQKVAQSDIRLVQFNSDFMSHSAQLFSYKGGQLIKSFPVFLKESNIGVIEDFGIQIRNHIDNPGKSRVYFTGNIGALPIPLSVGGVMEVVNNVDGYNGNYSIVSIENDPFMNTQYLVITLNYVGPGSVSAATGRFLSNSADFNVYEAQLSFAEVPEGKYYLKISGLNMNVDGIEYAGKVGESEPIHIRSKWKGTNLIQYSNIDNDYGDITWTTGYVGRIRVDSIFGPKRLTAGGERGVSRNSNYDAVKTYAKKVRGVLFESYMLPPYLHEKLGLIFDCDSFTINGVPYQSTESYADPQYIDRFKLANSSIKLEQIGWNKKYNSHDIGTVADGGFLMTEQGFLKL